MISVQSFVCYLGPEVCKQTHGCAISSPRTAEWQLLAASAIISMQYLSLACKKNTTPFNTSNATLKMFHQVRQGEAQLRAESPVRTLLGWHVWRRLHSLHLWWCFNAFPSIMSCACRVWLPHCPFWMLHGDLLSLFNLTGKMAQGHLSQGRIRESGTPFSVNLSTCNSAKPEARKHPNSASKLISIVYFHFQLCGHFRCLHFYLQLLQSTVTKALFTRHSAQHSTAPTFLHPDTECRFGSVCSDTGQLTVMHFRCRTKRTLEQIHLQSNCQQTGGPLVFLCFKTQPWVSACATCQIHSSVIKEPLSYILLPALIFQENGMQNSSIQRDAMLLPSDFKFWSGNRIQDSLLGIYLKASLVQLKQNLGNTNWLVRTLFYLGTVTWFPAVMHRLFCDTNTEGGWICSTHFILLRMVCFHQVLTSDWWGKTGG